LKGFTDLASVNRFLLDKGIDLNQSGGLIKGSPGRLLEQSSTLADEVKVKFDEGMEKVPGCYYEFSLRYADKSGVLFQGFIEQSVDKIFESTDRKS
jgi:hypothetical protein